MKKLLLILVPLFTTGCTVTAGIAKSENQWIDHHPIDEDLVGVVRAETNTQPAGFCEHISLLFFADRGISMCGISARWEIRK